MANYVEGLSDLLGVLDTTGRSPSGPSMIKTIDPDPREVITSNGDHSTHNLIDTVKVEAGSAVPVSTVALPQTIQFKGG